MKAKQEEWNAQEAAQKKLGRFKTVFNEAQEKELLKYTLILEERLFGFTRKDVCKIAFQLAVKNRIPHPFKEETAGKD